MPVLQVIVETIKKHIITYMNTKINQCELAIIMNNSKIISQILRNGKMYLHTHINNRKNKQYVTCYRETETDRLTGQRQIG